MAKNKIPGDVLKIMRTVDKQPMTVDIGGLAIKMSRKQYDELMKCTLFYFPIGKTEGDTPPSGFYIVDTKTKVAKFIWLAILKSSDCILKVADRDFKVNQPWKGYSYV